VTATPVSMQASSTGTRATADSEWRPQAWSNLSQVSTTDFLVVNVAASGALSSQKYITLKPA
jgi:hypothetical protein